MEGRILTLTDKEIDFLVHEKWFGQLAGNMVDLIEKPLKDEPDILRLLNERYDSTLDDLDKEYRELEEEFNSMLSDLVVVE